MNTIAQVAALACAAVMAAAAAFPARRRTTQLER
jgi:hypothetical protein